MGRPSGASRELGRVSPVEGTFTAPGTSASVELHGDFNVTLGGVFGARVRLERTFDGGATWHRVLAPARTTAGDHHHWSSPISVVLNEPEQGVEYRLVCASYANGPVIYRLSQ
ncbi:hypothetical protein [uncultured Rhodospira sp.]|uniref:hypothetical protein n=1 Tax=uncultured Rhodospira sp. TaxID=1936189 RepID=UPI002616820D|nr:hypothetical protein [uncultured Rhodospira sp.]